MTIFLNVAQLFLQKNIDRYVTSSIAADQTYINQALLKMGTGRNPQLSAYKQTFITSLSATIRQQPDLSNDEHTKNALLEALTTCKRIATEKSSEYKYNGGSMNRSIGNMEVLLRDMFSRFNETQLLDTPHDEDVLNQFNYHAALYLAHKLDDFINTTSLQSMLDNPGLTSRQSSTDRHITSLINNLRQCRGHIAAIPKDNPHYDKLKYEMVLAAIQRVIQNNMPGQDDRRLTFTLPYVASFAMRMPSVQISDAELQDYMGKAYGTIAETVITKTSDDLEQLERAADIATSPARPS